MVRKDYKLEIIRLLLKDKSYVREIAKKLGTNHPVVLRRLNELLKSNVVDFSEAGRNKVFFLKNSIEARKFVFMAEEYALIQVLAKYPLLRNIVEKIQKDRRIKLAVLFGSYAKGLANKKSDIDIYIDTSDISLKKELVMSDSKLSIKIGRLNKDNPLVKEIEKNHVIIKGVEAYYEKTRFFS